LLLALAVWQSKKACAFTCSEVTEHTRTNCAVIERFLPVRFAITESRVASTVQVSPA
jgi:RNA 3'-terminal phosphate cyclase (ATP)